MAKQMIQINSYGDKLTWVTRAEVERNIDPEEGAEASVSTCETCGDFIETDQDYRRCIDTGDEIHATCDFPAW